MEPVALSERDLIESYLARHKWLRFGINLALGRTIDKPSTTYRSMFLPDYLHDELKKADQEAGNVIAKEEVLVNGFTTPAQKADWWCSPFFIFSLLFAVSLFVKHKAFTVTLFSIIGLTGLVLLVLNIFSLHVEVKQNFNILWCNPLYLIYLPFIIKNRSNKFLSIAFLSTIVLTSLLWITGFQVFDRAIVPVLLMLAARLIVIIGNEWKTARNTVV